MFSAASVGTIDPRDVSKVVVAGSIVQLGYGIGGVGPPVALAARVVRPPQVTATIRYGVPPDGLGGVGLGALGLQLRYRAGDGQVVATLIEVAVPPGSPGEPTTVTETPLLEFDSTQFDAAQGGFLTHIATTGVDSPDARHVLEFGPNVYYIALALTGPEFVLGHPPAVSSIEIVGR